MSLPTALRRAYLTNAATATTLRSIQEMSFRSAIPLEPDADPAGGPPPEAQPPAEEPELHLVNALLRTMTEERHLIALLHGGVTHQVQALARWDADALSDVVTAFERYTFALREAVRERIALTRLLAGKLNARRPPRAPAGPLRSAVREVAALDSTVRAGAERALPDLLGGQLAVAAALDVWEPDQHSADPAPVIPARGATPEGSGRTDSLPPSPPQRALHPSAGPANEPR
ncbi:MAG: hypothetical protein H0W29_04145 [Gemmatimonadales bacterium]|nr:hypothetical protein [Gemmatimonadales bacterium]